MNRKDNVVRYAVVGMGHIAQVAVLPAFQHAKENSVLAAIVSGDAHKRDELSRKYRVPVHSYEDYDSLLASGQIDAVYIALPNNQHADYAVRAAQAHIHVLCEKPMAVTSEECERMMKAAAAGGVRLMIAYRLHFEESNMEAVRLARSGELGDPRFFSSTFSVNVKEGNYRTESSEGGGTLYDLGVYCVNAARYLFRAEPIEVTAFSANNGERRFAGIDEMTSAVLRFPGERLAQFVTSFGASDTSAYDLVGTEGSLRMENAYEYVGERTMTVMKGGKTSKKTFRQVDQFSAELIAFSKAVLTGVEPSPGGQEGLNDVRIVQAIYRSAMERRPVRIDAVPVPKRPDPAQVITKPAVKKPELVATGPSSD